MTMRLPTHPLNLYMHARLGLSYSRLPTKCRSDDPGGRREPRKVLKNLIQAIRREGKRLMQKGSQADNEGKGKTRQ